jgi:hypothetical protein
MYKHYLIRFYIGVDFMPYRVINIYPDITDEERKRREKEVAECVYRVFKRYEERVKKEKELAQKKIYDAN